MSTTQELTQTEWQVADTIAYRLILDESDHNELRKTIAYLRAYSDREHAGKQYFDYLNTLARNGDRIGHSRQTRGYLESIAKICQQYLVAYQDDVPAMLRILGWAARLMLYYKKAGPLAERPESPILSERESQIQAVNTAHGFKVGQKLEATVLTIKGNKVTYEILGTIRLTIKEPKKAALLKEGLITTVEVVALSEDKGENKGLKKVKCST